MQTKGKRLTNLSGDFIIFEFKSQEYWEAF